MAVDYSLLIASLTPILQYMFSSTFISALYGIIGFYAAKKSSGAAFDFNKFGKTLLIGLFAGFVATFTGLDFVTIQGWLSQGMIVVFLTKVVEILSAKVNVTPPPA